MNVKELIQILKRFPKAATVVVAGSDHIHVGAQVNQRDEWTVNIDGLEEIFVDNKPEAQIGFIVE